MNLNFLPVIALCIPLAACATTLPPPDNVRLTSQIENPENCVFIANVKGDENMYGGWAFNELSRKSAESRILQNAAKIGADTVLVEKATSGMIGTNMSGKAYRCAQGSSEGVPLT